MVRQKIAPYNVYKWLLKSSPVDNFHLLLVFLIEPARGPIFTVREHIVTHGFQGPNLTHLSTWYASPLYYENLMHCQFLSTLIECCFINYQLWINMMKTIQIKLSLPWAKMSWIPFPTLIAKAVILAHLQEDLFTAVKPPQCLEDFS